MPDVPEAGIRERKERMKVYFGKRPVNVTGRSMWRAVIVIVAIVLVVSAFYSVGADEVGVIQRFGRYVRQAEPGLHMKIPFGVDTVRKIKVKKVFKSEFGFRTIRADVRSTYSAKKYLGESLMLTGDLNVAEVEWIVQYRIRDPYKYLFKIKDPVETLRAMSQAVMRRVVGDRTVTEVLTIGRVEIGEQVATDLQALLDRFGAGMQVVTVKLQDVNPPEPVKPAFNEVNRAKQDKEKMINKAWEDYNKRIPRAKGEAEQMIAEAEGYALKRVNQAIGDVALFNQVYREYRLAPDVTRRRLYLEAMAEVLPKIREIYIVDEKQQTILPHLDIGRGGKGGDQ